MSELIHEAVSRITDEHTQHVKQLVLAAIAKGNGLAVWPLTPCNWALGPGVTDGTVTFDFRYMEVAPDTLALLERGVPVPALAGATIFHPPEDGFAHGGEVFQ